MRSVRSQKTMRAIPKNGETEMAENELQKLIKRIFNHIKEKYGYTDEQALIYLQGYQDCAEENQQSHERRDKMLRDTVAELCEAKRLLKSAVEDFKWLAKWHDDCELCGSRYDNGDCPVDGCKDCDEVYTWRHEAEALKLIGGKNNAP